MVCISSSLSLRGNEVRETEEIVLLLHITHSSLTTTVGSQDIPTARSSVGTDQSGAGPHRGAVLTRAPRPHLRTFEEGSTPRVDTSDSGKII